jgi:hypothetical protein
LPEFKDDELNAYLYSSSFDPDKTRIDLTKVDRIKIGLSTENDLLSLLGKPSGKALCPSALGEYKDKCAKDSEVWAWMEIGKSGTVFQHSYIRPSKLLFVVFDPASLVVDLKAVEND